jgi:hypothetical protein
MRNDVAARSGRDRTFAGMAPLLLPPCVVNGDERAAALHAAQSMKWS